VVVQVKNNPGMKDTSVMMSHWETNTDGRTYESPTSSPPLVQYSVNRRRSSVAVLLWTFDWDSPSSTPCLKSHGESRCSSMMISKAQTWYLSVLAATTGTVPLSSTPNMVSAWVPSLSRIPNSNAQPPYLSQAYPGMIAFDVASPPRQPRTHRRNTDRAPRRRQCSVSAAKNGDNNNNSSNNEDETMIGAQQSGPQFQGPHVHSEDSTLSEEPLTMRSNSAFDTLQDTSSLDDASASIAAPKTTAAEELVVSRALAKKMRVAKAQAEIDRILSLPDSAPFDAEAELKKVISIAPLGGSSSSSGGSASQSSTTTSPIDATVTPGSQTSAVSTDAFLSSSAASAITTTTTTHTAPDLEAELYQAVKQQDYDLAARKRLALDQSHMDDSLAVLQVNAAFYKAFSKKDTRLMESLWLQDDCVTSIHPSHQPIVGCKNVNLSWKRMFSSNNGSFQRNWMEPYNIRVAVKGGGGGSSNSGGTMAIVTCDERIYARRFVRGQRRQTELVNLLTATNIFRKVDGQWYMVHHHASWHVDSEASKQALKSSHGGGGGTVSSAALESLQKRQLATEPKETLSMDGILGIPGYGPLLGDSKKDAPKSPPRRIVMGSLSDILNGSLGDLLGNGGAPNNAKSDGNEVPQEGSAIIQFHRIDSDILGEDQDDDEDDDEEDDDEDEVEVDDLDDLERGNTKEAVSIIKEWAEARGKQTKKVAPSTKPAAAATKSTESAIRQQCIASLRHLCHQGLISSRQKRVLLTDIVSCTAKGEKSMIEVAYELLLSSDDDNDQNGTDGDIAGVDQRAMAQEEFADQCRLFAESHGLDSLR
jgi:ketosteroid isomerase-like protein